jgi:hypothetical protein
MGCGSLVTTLVNPSAKTQAHTYTIEVNPMSTESNKTAALKAALVAAEVAYEHGLEQGFAAGYAVGQQVGFVAGVISVQDALSSGLRHGSAECGRALESLKRLGIDNE